MTPQEAFDKACAALILQARRSYVEPTGCVYRGNDGAKCALGHLIPDEEYFHKMEGLNAYHVALRAPSLEGLDSDFLNDLQSAHDEAGDAFFISDFKSMAREVAAKYGLNADVLDRAL